MTTRPVPESRSTPAGRLTAGVPAVPAPAVSKARAEQPASPAAPQGGDVFAAGDWCGTPLPPRTLQTKPQRLDAIYNRQLPPSSPVGQLARAMDSQMGDQNIMSGVVGTLSGQLSAKQPSDVELERWGQAMLADYLDATEGQPLKEAEVQVLNPKAALERAGVIVAEGYAYNTSNPENVRHVLEGEDLGDGERLFGLRDLTSTLGPSVKALVVTGKVDDDSLTLNRVGLALFLDTATGVFVGFYGRQGDA
jgi:hypothetical protein